MPFKPPIDENVRFLYSCLLRSDYHSIDFTRVGRDFQINPPAARMRWARLRRNMALHAPFKNDPNAEALIDKTRSPRGSSSGPRKSKDNSRKRRKTMKMEDNVDDDEPILMIDPPVKKEEDDEKDEQEPGKTEDVSNQPDDGVNSGFEYMGQYNYSGVNSGLFWPVNDTTSQFKDGGFENGYGEEIPVDPQLHSFCAISSTPMNGFPPIEVQRTEIDHRNGSSGIFDAHIHHHSHYNSNYNFQPEILNDIVENEEDPIIAETTDSASNGDTSMGIMESMNFEVQPISITSDPNVLKSAEAPGSSKEHIDISTMVDPDADVTIAAKEKDNTKDADVIKDSNGADPSTRRASTPKPAPANHETCNNIDFNVEMATTTTTEEENCVLVMVVDNEISSKESTSKKIENNTQHEHEHRDDDEDNGNPPSEENFAVISPPTEQTLIFDTCPMSNMQTIMEGKTSPELEKQIPETLSVMDELSTPSIASPRSEEVATPAPSTRTEITIPGNSSPDDPIISNNSLREKEAEVNDTIVVKLTRRPPRNSSRLLVPLKPVVTPIYTCPQNKKQSTKPLPALTVTTPPSPHPAGRTLRSLRNRPNKAVHEPTKKNKCKSKRQERHGQVTTRRSARQQTVVNKEDKFIELYDEDEDDDLKDKAYKP